MLRRKFPVVFCVALSGAFPLAAQFNDYPISVPYVPTPPEVVEAMLKLAEVKKGDVVYDLGSGDGRIVIMAAQKFGARGVGIELNAERIKEAEENVKSAGVADRVHFIQKDMYEADVHEASVVTLYLLSSANMKLRPRLLKELKPGSRIVSQSFDMGDWKPDKEILAEGRRVYLWVVPPGGKIH